MADLDRPYVINGDDLRIALSGGDGKPPLVPNPRDVAAYIIGKFAAPLGDEPQLVDAHVCCPHAADLLAGDRELSLLAFIAGAFDGMSDFAVGRVMRYLSDRYPPD